MLRKVGFYDYPKSEVKSSLFFILKSLFLYVTLNVQKLDKYN